MKLMMLGVGSSGGTPQIGCACPTCSSSNLRNKRTRCSSAIETDSGEVILIDTGPDLRSQALREGLKRVDAVLYTHAHADHLNGIDDLRAFCLLRNAQIPLYGNAPTIENISTRFTYALREPGANRDLPALGVHVVSEPFEVCGERIIPIPIQHGRTAILGWRIRNLAYLTDVSSISEESMKLLEGLDVLLLDCLRAAAHDTHINLEQSLEYASLIQAKTTYLIHMTHELEYESLSAQLPENIHVAYDGLRLDFA